MSWMETERAALADSARAADPAGPTLCEGWTTRHLLAHLVLREQRPLQAAVDVMSRRQPGSERFLDQLVARADSAAGYQALVDRFERGAPKWSPMAWFGDRAHLLEYVVHHEDIRRAGAAPAPPRELPEDQRRTIWRYLASASRLFLRRSPVGVAMQTPAGSPVVLRKGSAIVTIVGEPVELALHLFGRRAAANVEVAGQPTARERYETWTG